MADDVISEAREAFRKAADAEQQNRATALEDIRFALLGEQWPREIAEQRLQEQRPMLTINKLPSFIRQVVNDARLNKPSIRVVPADSAADVRTADVLSGLIRNIEAISNADVAYDTAVEQAVVGGFGYWRIKLDYAYDDGFDLDILIERITNQFSVYGDPNSTAADSSDWDVCFVTDRIPKAEYKRKYGDRATASFDSDAWTSLGTEWIDNDGVIVAEWWRRYEVEREIVLLSDGRIFDAEELENNPDLQVGLELGQIEVKAQRKVKSHRVTQTIISGCDVLEEEKEFPGSFIPIVPVYGLEFFVEGQRYLRGLINHAKDAQQNFNYWRTTAAEVVALAPRVPWIGPARAFAEDARWATANRQSHAYLVYGGDVPPQRQPLDVGPAAGALQEALNASDDIKAIIGMYDASLGARSNETSGKAILARQREGDVATFHFIDNVTRAIRHTGKIIIGLIPKVYSGARIVRVLGEDGTERNVPINQQYATDAQGNQIPPEQAEMLKASGDAAVYMALHDLSVGKYDVVAKSGPSFTTRREEAAAQMTQVIQSFPESAPVIAPELAKNLDWPGADKIAEKFEKMLGGGDQQGQIPPEIQQQIEAGMQELQRLKAENDQLKANQGLEAAKIEIEKLRMAVEAEKIKTEQFEAETERLKLSLEQQRLQQAAALGLPVRP